MGGMEIPKWYSNNFWKIIAGILPVVVPTIGGFAFIDTGGITSYYCTVHNSFFGLPLYSYLLCPIYVALGLISIATITLALTPLIAFWVFKASAINSQNFTVWINKPESKNLHLRPGTLHENIFTLRFKDTEWRYFLNQTNVFVNIQSLVSMGTDIPDGGKNLEYKETLTTEPIFIKRLVPYEFNFLQIDKNDNKFWIKTENAERFKFSQGEYGFKIGVCTNIFGNFKIKNKSLLNVGLKNFGFRSVWREIYLTVDYSGYNKISVKIVEKEEYEQKVWHKRWLENQNATSK